MLLAPRTEPDLGESYLCEGGLALEQNDEPQGWSLRVHAGTARDVICHWAAGRSGRLRVSKTFGALLGEENKHRAFHKAGNI